MITRRTLLLYHFGFAIVFLLVGGLSIVALEALHPKANQIAFPPALDITARNGVAGEQDLERLRSSALFYFELARDLRRARIEDTESLFYNVRSLSLLVAALFGVGGLLSLAVRAMQRRNFSLDQVLTGSHPTEEDR